ncbi:MAG: hypothetical protein ACR2PS_11165 [Pseudomonadales bacterium]
MIAPNVDSAVDKKLKTGGFSGIALGVLALLACEIPVILTILGMGTLATGAHLIKPPFWMEILGISMAAAGTLALVIFFVRRRDRARKEQT